MAPFSSTYQPIVPPQQEKIKSLESKVELMLEKESKLLEDLQHTQIYHKQSVSQFELKLEDNDTTLAQSKNQYVLNCYLGDLAASSPLSSVLSLNSLDKVNIIV